MPFDRALRLRGVRYCIDRDMPANSPKSRREGFPTRRYPRHRARRLPQVRRCGSPPPLYECPHRMPLDSRGSRLRSRTSGPLPMQSRRLLLLRVSPVSLNWPLLPQHACRCQTLRGKRSTQLPYSPETPPPSPCFLPLRLYFPGPAISNQGEIESCSVPGHNHWSVTKVPIAL